MAIIINVKKLKRSRGNLFKIHAVMTRRSPIHKIIRYFFINNKKSGRTGNSLTKIFYQKPKAQSPTPYSNLQKSLCIYSCAILAEIILTSFLGRSPGIVSTVAILSTISNPSTTSPKTV